MGALPTDTIVAVSSPPGRSPRGLLRVSGAKARLVIASLLDTDDRDFPDRQLIPSRLRLSASATIPVLISSFEGPRTYTGQDMIELQCPGHPALLDRLVQSAIAAGCRLAEAGEFTFRAYLAGKLDLTQAEGIGATIAATSDSQLQAATLLRQGKLGQFAESLVNQLGTLLALVEAGIDFVDQDDVVAIWPRDLDEGLASVQSKLDELLANSRSWGAIEALPRVVLVGEPSAGKSTLLNALLGRTRAVIDAQPGTTRDVLAEPLTLSTADGRAVEVMLVDIAGLDDPANPLDADAQHAARRALCEADLLLHVIDEDDRDDLTLPLEAAADRVLVRSKCDVNPPSETAHCDVKLSAITGEGLDQLRSLILSRIGQRAVSLAADRLALQPRHESCLRAAMSHVLDARTKLQPQVNECALHDVELIAACLRTGLDELAGLGGELTPDDVIGRVFSTFCIGK